MTALIRFAKCGRCSLKACIISQKVCLFSITSLLLTSLDYCHHFQTKLINQMSSSYNVSDINRELSARLEADRERIATILNRDSPYVRIETVAMTARLEADRQRIAALRTHTRVPFSRTAVPANYTRCVSEGISDPGLIVQERYMDCDFIQLI
jgi:hypothetical protein